MDYKKLEKDEKNYVSYEVSFDAKELQDAVNSVYYEIKKDIVIPGFRKGKAPLKLVEKYYGKNVFYSDASQDLAQKAIEEIPKKEEFEQSGRPSIHITKLDEEGLVGEVTFVLMPTGTIENYKGVEVLEHGFGPIEDDVEEELKRIQKENGRKVPVVDGVVKEGNIVNIDFKGFFEDKPFEGGEAKGYDLEIGSHSFIPGFEEQIVGMKENETKDINVTFPENYQNEQLAGKPTRFEVTVNSIMENVLPTIDDEFAKDVSEFDTLDEYKASLKEDIEKKREKHINDEIAQQISDYLSDNVETEIPSEMLDFQVEQEATRFDNALRKQGLSMELFLQYNGISENAYLSSLRTRIERDIKREVALKDIFNKENITVSDKELEDELKELREKYGNDQVDKLPQENIDTIKEQILYRKAFAFVKDNAKITKCSDHEETKKAKKDSKKDSKKEVKKESKSEDKKDNKEAKKDNKKEDKKESK